MVLRISRVLHDALLDEAARDASNEVCGLLLGDTHVQAIVPCANVAVDPHRAFEIDPITLFQALRRERAGGPRVIGYYHSHPTGSAMPSAADRDQAVSDNRYWVIIAGPALAAWRLTTAGDFIAVDIFVADEGA